VGGPLAVFVVPDTDDQHRVEPSYALAEDERAAQASIAEGPMPKHPVHRGAPPLKPFRRHVRRLSREFVVALTRKPDTEQIRQPRQCTDPQSDLDDEGNR
jgi:hypothetical protein